MTAPVKIIHLCPQNPKKGENHPLPSSDDYFIASWAGLIAKRMVARYPDLDVEVWRCERDIKIKTEKIIYGLFGVVFPYQFPVIPNILTLEMIRQLRRYSQHYNLILNYHNLFDKFAIIGPLLLPKIRTILIQHGGLPFYSSGLKKYLKHRILYHNFKRLEAVTYLNIQAKEYLNRIGYPECRIFMPVGADFNVFTPGSKEEARKKLGLDMDTVFGLYVGKFFRLKGVENIIKAQTELKRKYQFSVMFVGGRKDKENDLFEEVVSSGNPWSPPVSWSELVYYYRAADFYVHPVFKENVGFDVAIIEAMACGLPVISTRLNLLEFDHNKVGRYIENYHSFIEKTEFMISNYNHFKDIRNTSRKYLDGNTGIVDKLYNIYFRDVY